MPLVAHETSYGAAVTAAPRPKKVESPGPLTSNCTESRPEPPSAALEATVTVPRSVAASAGCVSAPVGAGLAAGTGRAGLGVVLPAGSVVPTRRRELPWAT